MAAPVGVLLAQIGTPDAPTPAAVRRYLAKFLGDRRVVDLNPWLWRPILHLFVLRTRPKRSAALYRNVWTPDGSPLLVHSKAQQDGVQARLGDGYRVELGMRIGEPSLEGALDRLVAAGCAHVVVLPMFPQCSSATTASVLDGVAEWAKGTRRVPGLTFVRSFPDHPAYVAALAAEVRRSGAIPSPEAPLLVSFHGIPKRYAATDDPYPEECARTVRALVGVLALPERSWRVAFQSRFGREEWLGPYCFDALAALPREGIRAVSVLPASFVADCLETIDEIGREGRHVFEKAGGERYLRVSCPNASSEALDAFARIVREHVPPALAPP